MMQRMTGHPATAILRAVETLVRIERPDRQNPIMIVENIGSTDWASVTFIGQRHEFDLRFNGDADAVAAVLARLAESLGDMDIPLAGHFVAEIGVELACPASGRVRIAALTIKD